MRSTGRGHRDPGHRTPGRGKIENRAHAVSGQGIAGNTPGTRSRRNTVELVSDPDAHLIRACQEPAGEGFEEAFEALFLRYRDRVYSIAYRVTGSSTDALDVVQESFSLLMRKFGSFRFDSLFSTWLFRIVVNCSIDHRRRERSRARFTADGFHDPDRLELQDPEAGPAAAAENHELERHVHASIQQLSAKLRAIMVLRYLEGMSYDELAATLQISMGTVKSRLARAHIALERIMRGTMARFGDRFGRSEQEPMDESEAGGARGGVA